MGGYVPVDWDGLQMLFRIVSDSYERKSLILTTNLEFSKWGSVLSIQMDIFFLPQINIHIDLHINRMNEPAVALA